ncbi:MAG: MaoC family dehydratase N-terminal domain-containing protein, partial [Burkholderiales bacterium]
MAEPAVNDLSAWVGRERSETERLDARLVRWLAAALDRDDLLAASDGTVLPAGWHWVYFNAVEPRSGLGRDGHPRKGDFLPPTEQPRRMWAGSRLNWHRPFQAGVAIERRSTILRCERKQGRGGAMVFVTVGHRYLAEAAPILDEQHDIVYR